MDEVMDFTQACAYVKLAKPTMYQYIRAGKIPAFKVGRLWRFNKKILDEWMRQRTEHEMTIRSASQQEQA